jgi:hypothetical protein
MREELRLRTRARQVGYVRDTTGETQFWSFLAKKVSPDFLPGNCFNLPRLDFLPTSFRFGSPRGLNIRERFFLGLKALN